MSLSLTIIAPTGQPPANEPICSMSRSKQGIRGSMEALTGNYLEDCVDLEWELFSLVEELDWGDKGIFSNDYFKPYLSSRSPDDQRFYDQVATMTKTSIDQIFGDSCRRELRNDAFRFYLYVRAGYKIEWEKE